MRVGAEPVAVRVSRPAQAATVRIETASVRSMHMAAFTGIGMVLLLGAIFYLGTDSLRGSLTDGGGKLVNITITEAGTFEPPSVTVKPGDELIITNENPDPQVLKSNGTADLFVTQVLFDEPFSFIIPAAAIGKTYVYSSETLPENQLLEIVVTDGTEVASSSSSTAGDDVFIPLPPVSSESSESSSEASSSDSSESSSSSSSSIPVVQASSARSGQPLVVTLISSSSAGTTPTTTPATFSLRPAAGASTSSSLPAIGSSQENLPSNPYTVSNRLEAERLGLIPKASSSSSSLKSGAPLRRVETPVKTTTVTKKPRTNVETGPGPSVAIVTLLTVGLMALYYRRMMRTA